MCHNDSVIGNTLKFFLSANHSTLVAKVMLPNHGGGGDSGVQKSATAGHSRC